MQSMASTYELVDFFKEGETPETGHADSGLFEKQRPRKLKRFHTIPFLIQILLTIFPILFIVLAIAAITLDKKPTSSNGRTVQKAISLSPTIFPIIYAAIIGKFFKALGLFGAERGIKLKTLERLIGSQSLLAAFERQISLKGQYLLGLSMILVWALSPLGGQSALRLLEVTPRHDFTNTTLRILPIAASYRSAMGSLESAVDWWSSYAPIYMTALTTSETYQNSSQDLFGNVRIPSVDSLTASLTVPTGSWTTIDDTEEIPYSSMLGIPVAGIPVRGNLSFPIVSRYLAINCSSVGYVTNNTLSYTTIQNGVTFLMQGGEYGNTDKNNPVPATFNMTSATTYARDGDASVLNCTIAPRDVESTVFCSDQSCKVTAIRNLTVDLSSWWDTDYYSMETTFRYLPLSTVGLTTVVSSSSLTELWLQNPYSHYASDAVSDYINMANLSLVPLQTLSRNFEVLYNTFWQSTYGSSWLFGNLSTANMSVYDNLTTAISLTPFSFNTSQVTVTTTDGEEYTTNRVFAAILLAISCVLLLAGAATIVFMSMTLAPDILGYVSSYTRDNPYVAINQASYLDGLDRARAMKEARVMIGDVNVGSETGHIAFAATAPVQRLRSDRLYD